MDGSCPYYEFLGFRSVDGSFRNSQSLGLWMASFPMICWAMDGYEFIGFRATDDNFPYELIGFGAMDGNCPYEFTGCGTMGGHCPINS